MTSQIEVGNGITTGFLQVLAEEMSADMSQMRYGMFNKNSIDVVDTWVAGSTGGEGGSNAMSGTGPKIRNVGALAYNALLSMASAKLGVPVANLTVKSGTVTNYRAEARGCPPKPSRNAVRTYSASSGFTARRIGCRAT